MNDAVRLAVGTLTVLRVPAPRTVDRRVGGRAMALAPLVGLLLGLIAAVIGACADWADLSPLVCAVLVVGVLALLTRGLHLDGLADTADGLGSGRRGADALAVMSKSDIGPFGVATLVLVLMLQVALLAQLWGDDHGPAAVVIAVVASRTVLPVICRAGVSGAKATGLGSVVASSVGRTALVLSVTTAAAVVVVVGLVDDGAAGAVRAIVAASLGVVVGAVFAERRCARRFGGVTGDVLGSAVELTFVVALFLLAL